MQLYFRRSGSSRDTVLQNQVERPAQKWLAALAPTRGTRPGLTIDPVGFELLAAPVDEVREAWRGTGRARNIARQQIRALLNEAIAASEEGSTAIPPPDTWTGLDRSLIVSRELRTAPRDHPHPNAFSALSRRRH